jgi:hypothetical protein
VAYLPAGIDAALWGHAYPYQRVLLARAIAWAAGAVPPVRVEAPMCVQVACYERGAERIIHLFNNLNTTAHHGRPGTEVPLREETVPIAGVRVYFAAAPRRCTLQPEGRALPVRRDGAGRFVEVPRLELHALVVAEP